MSKRNGHPAPQKTGEKRGAYRCPPVETRFKPGNTAAKGKGRPLGSISIWARIQRELRKRITEDGPLQGKRRADAVAKAFVDEAMAGKWPQLKELIDREQGKVPERVADANGEPITFTLKIGERNVDHAN